MWLAQFLIGGFGISGIVTSAVALFKLRPQRTMIEAQASSEVMRAAAREIEDLGHRVLESSCACPSCVGTRGMSLDRQRWDSTGRSADEREEEKVRAAAEPLGEQPTADELNMAYARGELTHAEWETALDQAIAREFPDDILDASE